MYITIQLYIYIYIYYETAYYFQLTLVVGFFMRVLHVFCCHSNIFNSLLLTFITGVCSEIPLLYCLAFCGNQSFEFYRNSTDLLPHDTGSGSGECRNSLQTVISFLFLFTCTLLLYSSFGSIF